MHISESCRKNTENAIALQNCDYLRNFLSEEVLKLEKLTVMKELIMTVVYKFAKPQFALTQLVSQHFLLLNLLLHNCTWKC